MKLCLYIKDRFIDELEIPANKSVNIQQYKEALLSTYKNEISKDAKNVRFVLNTTADGGDTFSNTFKHYDNFKEGLDGKQS